MKYWLEAKLENEDEAICSECKSVKEAPEIVFVEMQMFQGNMPNLIELHMEPTGKYLCRECGSLTLF